MNKQYKEIEEHIVGGFKDWLGHIGIDSKIFTDEQYRLLVLNSLFNAYQIEMQEIRNQMHVQNQVATNNNEVELENDSSNNTINNDDNIVQIDFKNKK